MLIVTGANGKLGRMVVQELLKRVPATQLAASVRDPLQAEDLTRKGVRVRRGDFSDAASLMHSFEGARRILIVSSNTSGHQAVMQHRTAIDAAKAAGAQRIFYTSHVGSSASSPFAPMPDHAATEVALQESGVAFTSLRNGFYADTVRLMLGASPSTGELALPEDGPVSWTSHADLAEATSIIMTDDGPKESTTVNLTASDALDMTDVAALASHFAGRTIRRLVVADTDYHADMLARGVPPARADLMVGLFQASRLGQFACVDTTLARILGRAPQTLSDVLRG